MSRQERLTNFRILFKIFILSVGRCFGAAVWRRGKRRVISVELFQSELFWRVILMQIRSFKVMNFGSLQSQLSSNTLL